jgi:cysteinyl-tRNA synthetase
MLKDLSRLEAQFTAAMDDDLDTTRALRLLSRFLRSKKREMRSHKSLASSICETAVKRILALSSIIGILAA